jgi:hypothetical protein
MDMNMKARIQHTDASILLAHDIAAYPDRVKQTEARADTIARLKARLLARSDDAARIMRVKVLKAQVDAGTYIVDSRAMAKKIQFLPVICDMPEREKDDISPAIQEDEPHA